VKEKVRRSISIEEIIQYCTNRCEDSGSIPG